jgi:hypothetical protein
MAIELLPAPAVFFRAILRAYTQYADYVTCLIVRLRSLY